MRDFFDLIERNVRFEYHLGGSTWVAFPHTTGWRVVPSLVIFQCNSALVIEMADRKSERVEPGEAVAITPGLLHNITKTNRRGGYFYWIHCQCEVLQGVSLFSLVEPPLIVRGAQARKIGRINRDFAAVATRESSLASILRRQALGWELIRSLLESVTLREDRIDRIRDFTRLTPVLAYIEENLAKPIKHDFLARTAGLSPSRFHFLFRSAFGSAPCEYVQKVRLKKAQQLLIRTDRPVAEIGREVGHCDPYHFSRTFRRSFGISPAKDRKQMNFGSF